MVLTAYSEYSLNTAWDTQENNLAYFNIRAAQTLSENLALALEYRHRNAYSWRKVDHDNFMIDSFRSREELRHSLLSDRRDTFLAHIFLRLMPELAIELHSRHGWGRRQAKSYTEYEVDVLTLLRNTIRLSFSFRHRETGNDYSIRVSFGGGSHSADTRFRKIGQGNNTLP